ncbi:MAG: hypothetical protein GY929_27735 [Actinomycetia bacterium]|nr:hypothetical protein [Actinomycetes bacterium]
MFNRPPARPHRLWRGRALAALLVAGLALLTGVSPVRSQGGLQDLRDERDRISRQQAEAAGAIDALRADEAVIVEALGALEADIARGEARLVGIEQAIDVAEHEGASIEAQIAATIAESRAVRQRVAQMAVDAYVRGDLSGDDLAVLGGENPLDAERYRALVELVTGRGDRAVEELRAVEDDLAYLREERAAARAEADRKAGEAEEQLAALDEARTRQLEFAAEVASRIESRLTEADQLSTRQILVSEEIRQIELALTSKLPPGAASGPVTPAMRSDVVRVDAPEGDDTYVRGAIADDLANLYAAAAADGIALGGWGWRDPSMQIEVRRNNCGTSDWEVYKKPAALCNPPAARPGFSQHEAGLAVDFTYKGAVISHQYSVAFVWMNGNAHRWGFYNLPGEPWHWSTTGH